MKYKPEYLSKTFVIIALLLLLSVLPGKAFASDTVTEDAMAEDVVTEAEPADPVPVEEAPSVSSITVSDTILYEYNGGNWVSSGGPEWFCYSAPFPAEIEVTMENGTIYSGNLDTVIGLYYEDYGIWPSFSSSFVAVQSEADPFTAGQSYEATLTFVDSSVNYHVEILPNPISSITVQDTVCVENNNGYYQTAANGQKWFIYDGVIPPSVTVRIQDGRVYSGTVFDVQDRLNNVYDASFSWAMSFVDQQSAEHPFTVGNTYYAVFSLGGKRAYYRVTIRENPIATITASDAVIMEGTNGNWEQRADGESWYQYYTVWPDTVTVRTTDGKSFTGAPWNVSDELYQEYGFRFNPWSQYVDHQNEANPFTAGNTYYAVFSLGERKAYYRLTIQESPIASVTAENVTIIEDINGSWEQGINGESWFRYYDVMPSKVTVTAKDGKSFVGDPWDVLDELYQEYGFRFSYSYHFIDNQNEANPFTADHTYNAELACNGVSAPYTVSIQKHPIASMTATDGVMYEHLSGYYQTAENGEKWFCYQPVEPSSVTVTMTDGESFSGTISEIMLFVQGKLNEGKPNSTVAYTWSMGFAGQQDYENQFTVGNSYEVLMTVAGKKVSYQVELRADPIANITAEDTAVYAYSRGSYQKTDSGETWYCYYALEPSEVTVTTTDGRSYSGTLYQVSDQVRNDYGVWINGNFSVVNQQSYENQLNAGEVYDAVWTVGAQKANYQIRIQESPILSVEAGDGICYENVDGYIRQEADGTQWRCYSCPMPEQVTIRTEKGETFSGAFRKAYDQLCEAYQYSFGYSWEFAEEQTLHNQFAAGTTHPAILRLGGKTTDYTIGIASVENSGSLGNDLMWSLDDAGTLTVSGSGAIPDFATYRSMPWYPVRNQIKAVVIQDGITAVGDKAFGDCWHMETLQLGNSVGRIGQDAFSYCGNFDELSIPDSVTDIDDFAFYRCSNLGTITLGGGLTHIGSRAFADCAKIETLTIPAGVTEIGEGALCGCTSLRNLQVADGNTAYCTDGSGVLYNSDETRLLFAPASLAGAYNVAHTVTDIVYGGFAGCSSLTKVELPTTLENIGTYAFGNCSGITTLEIPDRVENIGDNSFASCASLKTISFSGDAPAFGNSALFQDTTLAYYPAENASWTAAKMKNYGGRITWIVDNRNIVPENPDIVLPESLKTIEAEAFAGGSFTYVRLSENVTNIGNKAFADCTGLKYIYIPAATTDIATDAFEEVPYGLIILGRSGSAAEAYATAHRYLFKPVA